MIMGRGKWYELVVGMIVMNDHGEVIYVDKRHWARDWNLETLIKKWFYFPFEFQMMEYLAPLLSGNHPLYLFQLQSHSKFSDGHIGHRGHSVPLFVRFPIWEGVMEKRIGDNKLIDVARKVIVRNKR